MSDFNTQQRRSKTTIQVFMLSLAATCGLIWGCANQAPTSEPAKKSSVPLAAPTKQTSQEAKTSETPRAASTSTTNTASSSNSTTPGVISNQAWADKLKVAAGQTSLPFDGAGWEAMFAKDLQGWKETKFAGHGEAQVESGLLVLNMGDPFTGVNYTNTFPKMGYEIALDAMRLMGSDFFCGLTVPVGDSFCTLIVGGWGGSLVGISSLDGMDASENETTKYMNFENGTWYRIRLRVTEGRLEGWIDNEKLINVLTKDRKISLRPGEIDLSTPIGIACWQTTTALREIKYRKVDQPEGPPKKY